MCLNEDVNDEAEDEASVLRRCRDEGPPGPAGLAPALPSIPGQGKRKGPVVPSMHGPPLSHCVSWLSALWTLDVPFDTFHLGAGGAPRHESMIVQQNLAVVRRTPTPRRWHLTVLVRNVEVAAGEADLVLQDPTGEMRASVDRRMLQAWPGKVTQGATLILAGVMAVPASRARATDCQLLIMSKSLVTPIHPSDVPEDKAKRLLADAEETLRGAGHERQPLFDA